MIVFSSSLVLAAASDPSIDLNAPVFGYRSEVTVNTIAATDEAAGYPVTNLANVSTASLWKAADASGAKYLTITPSVAAALDYIAVARHNFGSAQIAVTVEGREDGGDPWAEIVAEFMPTDDNALILRFDETVYHSIRLKLAQGGAPAQAAVVYTGLLLVSPQRIYVGHTPITLNRRTQIANGMSESGNFLGRVITGSNLSTSVSLTHLKPDWYRSDFDPFVDAAREAPFFFAWRPQQYPNETAFAWLASDPQPSNMMSNGMMEVSLEMQGAAA